MGTLLSADPSNGVAFKDMLNPRSRFLLTLSMLAAVAVYAVAADQSPAPQDSPHAVQSPGKEAAQKPAPATSLKPAPAVSPQTARPVAQQAAPAGGVVVFIDPATGQIRQPDASEIGGLVTPVGPAPKAPEPALIQGPGGAVGARLGEGSLTYMVVTAAPGGKLAMDCVTGEKAAAARVTSPAATAASAVPQAKDTSAHPQDTHDVKVPR